VSRSKNKPQKLENLLEAIKECLENGNYILTKHALLRQRERTINLAETVHVLKTGYEEKKKTVFDEKQNTWKYSIRGKTIIDKRDVRIIIAFDDNGMLIITVMFIGNI